VRWLHVESQLACEFPFVYVGGAGWWPTVEGSHARIDVKGGRVYVMDLGEAEAGTYMDDNMCATLRTPVSRRTPNVPTPRRRRLTAKIDVYWNRRVQIAFKRIISDGAGVHHPIGCVATPAELGQQKKFPA
jgi:pSer/pThr/pTyr-binding forkhead associated (FHA) protein